MVFNYFIVMKNENLSDLVKNHPPQKLIILQGKKFGTKKPHDYLICNFFFLPIARNPIPETPINIIIPLSNIFSAIGLSGSIKTAKRGIAEIIINIIPLISYPFNFVSIFFFPLNKYPIKIINIFGGFQ